MQNIERVLSKSSGSIRLRRLQRNKLLLRNFFVQRLRFHDQLRQVSFPLESGFTRSRPTEAYHKLLMILFFRTFYYAKRGCSRMSSQLAGGTDVREITRDLPVVPMVIENQTVQRRVKIEHCASARVQNPWSGGAGFERSGAEGAERTAPTPLRSTYFLILRSTAPAKFLDT